MVTQRDAAASSRTPRGSRASYAGGSDVESSRGSSGAVISENGSNAAASSRAHRFSLSSFRKLLRRGHDAERSVVSQPGATGSASARTDNSLSLPEKSPRQKPEIVSLIASADDGYLVRPLSLSSHDELDGPAHTSVTVAAAPRVQSNVTRHHSAGSRTGTVDNAEPREHRGLHAGSARDSASPPVCGYRIGEFPSRLGLSDAQYRCVMERHQRLVDITTLAKRCHRIISIKSLEDLNESPPQHEGGDRAHKGGALHSPTDGADPDFRVPQSDHLRTRVPSPPPPVALTLDIDAAESSASVTAGDRSARSLVSPRVDDSVSRSPRLASSRATVSDPYTLFLYHCSMVRLRVELLDSLADTLQQSFDEAKARCAHALQHKSTQRSEKAIRERQRAVHALLCLWRDRANNRVVTADVYSEAVDCLGGLPLVMPLTCHADLLKLSSSTRTRGSSSVARKTCVEDVVHTAWVTPAERAARGEFLQDSARLRTAQEFHVHFLASAITASFRRQESKCSAIEAFLVESLGKLFPGPTRFRASRGATVTSVSWRRRLLEESGDEVVSRLLLAQLFLFSEDACPLSPGTPTLSAGSPSTKGSPTPQKATSAALMPVSPLLLMSSPLRSALKASSAYPQEDFSESSLSLPTHTGGGVRSTKHVSFQLDDSPTLRAHTTAATSFCAAAPGHVEQLMTWMGSLRSHANHTISDTSMRLEHVEQVHYFQLIQMPSGPSRPLTLSVTSSPSLKAHSRPGSLRAIGGDSQKGRELSDSERVSTKEAASSGCGDPAECAVM